MKALLRAMVDIECAPQTRSAALGRARGRRPVPTDRRANAISGGRRGSAFDDARPSERRRRRPDRARVRVPGPGGAAVQTLCLRRGLTVWRCGNDTPGTDPRDLFEYDDGDNDHDHDHDRPCGLRRGPRPRVA